MLNNKVKLATRLIMTMSVVTGVSAAGLERSSQQIDVLFESGTYADIGYTHISPEIKGTDVNDNHISDIAEDFQTLNYAVKMDLTPGFRLAVIYDEPYGAKVKFKGDSNFIATNLPATNANTRVEVKSKNLTTLLGYNLNKNFMIYGGPALQELSADVHLRGVTYQASSGYNNSFDDIAIGWVTGLSYALPEIGFRASLTYRSEVDHNTTIKEDVPLADLIEFPYSHTNKGNITMPESLNLNLQTGLNPTTALFAKVRWVPWGDFSYFAPVLKATTASLGLVGGKGVPLLKYHDDQTAIEVGGSKRLSSKLAISASGLWDSGAGAPAPTLGPVDGYWGVGLAAKYNINDKLALSLGGRYMWFGDVKGEVSDGRIVGDFRDNTGYVIGTKLSYQMK